MSKKKRKFSQKALRYVKQDYLDGLANVYTSDNDEQAAYDYVVAQIRKFIRSIK